MSSVPEYIQLEGFVVQYPESTFLSGTERLRINDAIRDDDNAPDKTEGLADRSSKTMLLSDTERPSRDDATQDTNKVRTDRLGKWTFGRWAILVFDTIFSLFPIVFVVIAVIAATLHGKQVSSLGSDIQEAILLLPSVFPIIFAALMGKFFKALALYRAERGVLLGSLERLVGCQSLFGSIERQIASRKVDMFGLLIVLTWALSPVGGQSALRLITLSPYPMEFNTTVRYLLIDAAASTYMWGASEAESGWPSYAPMYMATLRTTKAQSSSTDPWGNIRIPDIDPFLHDNASSEDGWVQVDYSNIRFDYSSLLGIPIIGIPSAGIATFNITSRYFILAYDGISWLQNYTKYSPDSYTTSFQMVPNNSTLSFDSSPNRLISFHMDSLTDPNHVNVSHTNLTVGVRDVDSSIHCQDQDCHVTAMRLSTMPVDERLPFVQSVHEVLWSELPFVTVGMKSHNSGTILGSTSTEQWLFDPTSDIFQTTGFVNLSSLNPQVLATRMQVVYNTFFQATYGVEYLVGNLTNNLTYYDHAPTTDGTISFGSSQAHVVQFDGQIYVCHWMYAILFSIISLILLAAGLATLVLKNMTLAPDILGYASTCTRDNAYAVLNQNFDRAVSHKDGLGQARELQRVRVMIGDVRAESEVGHIAFATMRAGPQRLRKGRKYD